MKKLYKIASLIALSLLFCVGYSGLLKVSQDHSTISRSNVVCNQSPSTSNSCLSVGHIKIRHRSALQNETIVINYPVNPVFINVSTSECTQDYFAKWHTYFLGTAQRLPEQTALSPAFGLRAPPFYC